MRGLFHVTGLTLAALAVAMAVPVLAGGFESTPQGAHQAATVRFGCPTAPLMLAARPGLSQRETGDPAWPAPPGTPLSTPH